MMYLQIIGLVILYPFVLYLSGRIIFAAYYQSKFFFLTQLKKEFHDGQKTRE